VHRGKQAPASVIEQTPRLGCGPIVFASYTGIWGGAERALLDTIVGVEEPAILLCPDGLLAEHARAAGIPVLARPERPLEMRGGLCARAGAALRLLAHAAEIRTLVRAAQPRAVVAWNMRSGIACAAALLRLDRRGLRPPLIFQQSDFLPVGATAHVVRLAARAADRVIVNSAAVASDLAYGGPCSVVYPGIDVDAYDATPLPPGPPRVLLLGAVVPIKRPQLALEAVARAARELPELQLVVAGHHIGGRSPQLLSELRRRAAEPDLAGRVEFVGHVKDPGGALARSWCLLHCADREGFGLVILEAMASGRPVVAPASGGPAEIVEPECGRLYSPGDAAAAARALVALLSDREQVRRAGDRARQRAECFRHDVAAQRWKSAASDVIPCAPVRDGEPGRGLTLVTVTHNSAAYVQRFLRSVARHLPGAAVVVADSGSDDASLAVARGWSGDARVIELGENVGYGRAANAGVAAADTRACAVVNPDVEVIDDSLAALAAEATRRGAPDRLLAPLVLRPDGTRQDTVHGEPVSAAAVVNAAFPPAALPGALRRHLEPWCTDEPRRVAWAVGCCLLARTETLSWLGPFSERIFLYGEDLELGLRARDAGIETWWWPAARVIHAGANASRHAFGKEPFDLLATQRQAVVAERRGARTARWDARLQLITLIDRIALKTLLRRATARERQQLAALRKAAHVRPGHDGSTHNGDPPNRPAAPHGRRPHPRSSPVPDEEAPYQRSALTD
jgi:GT2 family glycosyltransferase/glycosyltransferase involved in cell wall biosynthesis